MLKLEKSKVVKGWPVTIPVPLPGGRVAKHKVEVDFEILGQDDFNGIVAGGDGDRQLLARTVVGWGEDQFQDADGNLLVYSEEAKAALASLPYARIALVDAYMEASQGRGAARKN